MKPLKVLIGCESSGKVRRAFRALGHDAWSCDLLPADDNSEHHIQGDVFDAIASDVWDIGIFHPPCTYLSVSGLHWNKRVEGREQQTEDALAFVRRLLVAQGASEVARHTHRRAPHGQRQTPLGESDRQWSEPATSQ